MNSFKDITDYLSNMYPNTNVFVISDEHFFHNNIIGLTRNNFDSLEDMHNYIINKHNSVVSKDDIVIFLGDFCFKKCEIESILSKLNGHKFLILGNHDDERVVGTYKKLGFENVFMFSVRFKNSILSHYPLLGSESTVLNNMHKKEFNKEGFINYYGHEHSLLNTYNNSINVACENVDYKPMLIGKTHERNNNRKSIIECDNLDDLLFFVSKEKSIKKSIVLKDLIYQMMIESIGLEACFYGSYLLYKKYGFINDFGDLDATILYDKDLSRKKNQDKLYSLTDKVYESLKDISSFNLSYHKKIGALSILSNKYSDGANGITDTYLDMNIILNDVYRTSDFVYYGTNTLLEDVCRKYNSDLLTEYDFPRNNVMSLNALGDITNVILQYLYQPYNSYTNEKLLKKLRFLSRHLTKSDDISDYMIRYLIRNILFFDKTNRQGEIDYMFSLDRIDLSKLPLSLRNMIEAVIYDSEYSDIFGYLKESSDVISSCDEILKLKMN